MGGCVGGVRWARESGRERRGGRGREGEWKRGQRWGRVGWVVFVRASKAKKRQRCGGEREREREWRLSTHRSLWHRGGLLVLLSG